MESQGALSIRLERHVCRLASEIGPRFPGNPKSIQLTEQWIEQELQNSGYQLTRETYDARGDVVSNLIIEIPGTKRSDEILIVGAHYDTVPSTPGADDNASAVAVLLETARLLAGEKFSRTVRFVFFACEEPPYFHFNEMGSQFHARGCRSRKEKIIGMLCLEMLGYYSDEPGSQQVPATIPKAVHWLFPKTGNFLAAVANLRSIRLLLRFRQGFKNAIRFPLFSIALPEIINEIRRSDHSSFWDQNYPAIMLTDTSFLRNPHYHCATDQADTLDYMRMASVTEGLCGAVRLLARRDKSAQSHLA
jgi:Zn-dependent M28 family amino/carboxypeptidase